MTFERTGWETLAGAAAGRLPPGFAGATVRRAAARRARQRAEVRGMAATVLAAALLVNGTHWVRTAQEQAQNMKLWQQAGAQTEQLEGAWR
jgi:hypothetical protein